jgi:hypothetical protein
MVTDVGDSAPGDSAGDGSEGPVLAVGDPENDRLGVAGGDVEVQAAVTTSSATSGTPAPRDDRMQRHAIKPEREAREARVSASWPGE